MFNFKIHRKKSPANSKTRIVRVLISETRLFHLFDVFLP